MEKKIVTREFRLVDETGVVRRVNVTVERDPDILVEVGIDHIVDENGALRNIVGMLVPRRNDVVRIDITTLERVGA